MREDFIEVYEAFASKYGEQSQRYQCIEEMSELIKELCKLDRYKGTDNESQILDNIKEELADVLNMVEQLEYIFGAEDIEKIRTQKIERGKNTVLIQCCLLSHKEIEIALRKETELMKTLRKMFKMRPLHHNHFMLASL